MKLRILLKLKIVLIRIETISIKTTTQQKETVQLNRLFSLFYVVKFFNSYSSFSSYNLSQKNLNFEFKNNAYFHLNFLIIYCTLQVDLSIKKLKSEYVLTTY